MADYTISQPLHDLDAAAGGAQTTYYTASSWPGCCTVPVEVSGARPTVGLWVPGSYASVWDVFEVSVPDDSRNDFADATVRTWLTIAAGRINEHLGNRGWPVPLTAWSKTVVWANCELAYIGAARKRGINTEALLSDFQRREDRVEKWLRDAQNRLITPDPRPSDAGLGSQAVGYKGPQARGWDSVSVRAGGTWRWP